MILNPFLEGLIAVVLGATLVVVAKVAGVPELTGSGLMIVGAGGGYILRELGPATPGK